MKTFRPLPVMLATALGTLAAPSDALADPDTSPFSERQVIELTASGLDKVNTASCGILLTNKVGSQWHRYVFKAWQVGNKMTPSGGVACQSGHCIKHWTSPTSSGPWKKQANVKSIGSAADATYAVHCNPITTGDNDDYEWQFFGAPFSTPNSIPLTASSPASHVANTYASSPPNWMGICRVVYRGGTYVGTLRYETGKKFRVWNHTDGRYDVQMTAMQMPQLRQVCSVRLHDGNQRRFHNFQALFGDIGESKWKSPTASGGQPNQAFVAGKLDSGSVYACVARQAYKFGNVTVGTKRAVGWWRPGDDECHVPTMSNSGLGGAQPQPVVFSVLTK